MMTIMAITSFCFTILAVDLAAGRYSREGEGARFEELKADSQYRGLESWGIRRV